MKSPFPGMDPYLEQYWGDVHTPSEADIVLQLQPLIDHCYQSGRYDKIDYGQPLRPPLAESDRQWADALSGERT